MIKSLKIILSLVILGAVGVGSYIIPTLITPESYTITYVSPYGDVLQPVTYEDAIDLELPVIAYPGYTFLGWYEGDMKVEDGNYSKDMTLVARFLPVVLEVTLKLEDDVNLTYDYGQNLNLTIPSKEGYRFLGWYEDASLTTVFNGTKALEDLILYPKYEAILPTEYVVYIISEDDGLIETLTFDIGSGVVLPILTKEGYTLSGFIESKTKAFITSGTVLDEETILIAQFTLNTYMLSFEDDDVSSLSVLHGQDVILPVPDKAGYLFLGWYEDDALTVPFDASSYGNKTLYPKYELLGEDSFAHYLISEFDGLIDEIIMDKDEGVTLPELTKEGYNFLGWQVSGSDTFINNGDVINQNAVITAIFEPLLKTYTISFITGDSEPIAPVTVEEGSMFTLPTAPELFGYQFKGWVTDIQFDGFNLNSTLITESFEVTKDMTLFANFDYMIPGANIFYQPFKVNNQVLGYTITEITYDTDEVIDFMILPQTYLGLPVVAISDYAFAGLDYLKEVVVPEGYLSIHDGAFASSSIETIHLPESLISITDYAFEGSMIQNIHFDENAKLTSIGENAFEDTTALFSIVIPKSVRTIGDSAFRESNLVTITFEEGSLLYFIDQNAFRDSKITDIELPLTLQHIDNRAFQDTPLTSIHLKENMTYLGREVFRDTSISSIEVDAPENYVQIDKNIFEGTPILSVEGVLIVSGIVFGYDPSLNDIGFDLIVPEGVTMIADNAFEEANILSLLFETSHIRRMDGAFSYATIGSTFTLPTSDHYRNAFYDADLTETFALTIPYVDDANYSYMFAYASMSNVTVTVPQTLPNGDYAFNRTNIYEVILSSDVTRLDYGFFSGTTTQILTVEGQAIEIGNFSMAFQSLSTYTLADDIRFIPISDNPFGSTFRSSTSNFVNTNGYVSFGNVLISTLGVIGNDLVIPDGITVLNPYSLTRNIATIDLNDTEYILSNAFQERNFTYAENPEVTLTSVIKFVSPYAFTDWNTRAMTVTLEGFHAETTSLHLNITKTTGYYAGLDFDEDGFKRVGDFIYDYDVANFGSDVVIPEGVTKIAQFTFRNLGITSLTATTPLEYIGYDAFSQNDALTNILLSNDTNGDIFVDYDTLENGVPTFGDIPDAMHIEMQIMNFSDLVYARNFVAEENGLIIHENIVVGYVGNASHVVIPEGVVAIAEYAFRFSFVESITLPSTLKSIQRYAFADTVYLKELLFDESLTLIYIGRNVIQHSYLDFTMLPVANVYHSNAMEYGEIYFDYD